MKGHIKSKYGQLFLTHEWMKRNKGGLITLQKQNNRGGGSYLGRGRSNFQANGAG